MKRPWQDGSVLACLRDVAVAELRYRGVKIPLPFKDQTMGMYSLVADVQRTVLEKYVCELEAGTVEEALDIAYEHFSTFPNSELDLKVRRRAEENTVSTNVLYIEHEYMNRSANDGPEVA